MSNKSESQKDYAEFVKELEGLSILKPKDRKIFEEHMWTIYLYEGEKGVGKFMPPLLAKLNQLSHQLLHAIPTDPRCVTCGTPFSGLGAPVMRVIGRGQSQLNPSLCNVCEKALLKSKGGADVDVSMVFADIRGSTELSESMPPREFQELIGRFFTAASQVVIDGLGFVDKFIGDEVTCYFTPGVAGAEHAKRAIEVAQGILRVTGHGSPEGPWAPVGVGVASGMSFLGMVGAVDGRAEMNVVGEVPITGSRLAGKAKAGEVLVSEEAFAAAGLAEDGWEKVSLELKGRSEKQAARVWRL